MPEVLVAYRPSEEVRERVTNLIQQDKDEGLTLAEADGLANSLQIEHLLRLAKAQVRGRLAA